MRQFSLLLIALLALCNINAQNAVEKPVLTVEKFTGTGNEAAINLLRNKVVSAVQQAQRVEVVDVNNTAQLNRELERRKSELAMADAGRVSDMTALMSNCILKGSLDNLSVTKNVDKKTGDVSFSAKVTYTLTIVSAENGTVLAQKNFNGTGYGATDAGAAEEALNVKVTPITQFILNAFSVGGKVIAIDQADKKKAKTVYIDLGSSDGIKKGQKMEVFKEVEIAGEKSNKLIGEISVQEVMSASRSLCKVGKGGEDILQALEAGMTLPIKTKEAKSNFFQQMIEE